MVISKKSWHYRYLSCSCEIYDLDLPESLCGYFWKTVFLTVANLVLGSFVLGLISAIPLLFWSWLHNGSHGAKAGLIMLSVIAVVLGSIATYRVAVEKHEEKLRRDAARGIYPVEKPAGFLKVIWETMKAAKNKVCPFIKYEE